MPFDADALDSLSDDWMIGTYGERDGPLDPTGRPTPRDDRSQRSKRRDGVGVFGTSQDWGSGTSRLSKPTGLPRKQGEAGALQDFYAYLRRTDAGALDPAASHFRNARCGGASLSDASGGWDRLTPGTELRVGQSLAVPGYQLILQTDGALVLYKVFPSGAKDALWATGGPGAVRVAMQKEGNLVVYGANNRVFWATDNGGHPGAFAVLQPDGNFVVYQKDGKSVLWDSGTWGGVHAGDHDHSILKSIGSTFSSIGSGVASVGSAIGSGVVSVAKGIATPVAGLVTSPFKLASDIAQGKNVFQSLKDTVKRDLGNVAAVAPYVQTVLSIVPVLGSGVNAALSAGLAVAQGQPITSALVGALKSALPGGPLAASAFDAAYNVVRGQNIGDAALDAMRSQLPGGDVAKRAFDTAIAVAKGQNIQQALVASATGAALDAVKGSPIMTNALSSTQKTIAALSPVATRALSDVGPSVLKIAGNIAPALTTLSQGAALVQSGLLKNPQLRGLSVEDLAKTFNVTSNTAREGMGAVLSAVSRAGGTSAMNVAENVEKRLDPKMTFDTAMATLASHARIPATSHNVLGHGARELRYYTDRAGRLGRVAAFNARSAAGDAMGLDPSGTTYVVDPGDTMSKIALKVAGSSAKWPELAAANTQVKDPSKIFVGQKLALPFSWVKKTPTTPVKSAVTLPGPTVIATPTGSAASPVAVIPTSTPLTAVTSAVAAAQPTLRVGSSGTSVKAWQVVIGVTPDGQFGPATQAATIAWQKAHGLSADGVVGPATWAAAAKAPIAVTVPNPIATTSVSTTTPDVATTVSYVVSAGDTMSKIAQKFTGSSAKWPELASANAQVKDPNTLFVGQVLQIPASWGKVPAGAPVGAATSSPDFGAALGAVASKVASAVGGALPSAMPSLPGLPVTTTIAENPGAAPSLPPSLPGLPAPLALPSQASPSSYGDVTAPNATLGVALPPSSPMSGGPSYVPSTSTTMTTDGAVTQITNPSGQVMVSQPPIGGDAPPPAKPPVLQAGLGGNTGLLIAAAVLGGLFLMKK